MRIIHPDSCYISLRHSPCSGDNVMISEGEDDRHVVIPRYQEGRHLGEAEHQAGHQVGGEAGGAWAGEGGRGQVRQHQVQKDQGHQGHRGEQVDGQQV